MHSWQMVVSQFTMARRDSSAMTRPTNGVVSQAGDPSKIEEDKNEVRDYMKEVLFEKVVFIWNKGTLQLGGVLHKDYLMNCRAKIPGGKLMNATDSEAETYMNLLWTMMVKKNCYQEWLSHKRSAKYQAVQEKFASEYTRGSLLLVMDVFNCDCMSTKTIGLLNYRCFHFLLPMQRCAVNARLTG
jgi:hypothetical protein